jgi:hypothetical protein
MSTPSARDYRDSTHDEEIATNLNVDLSTIELRAEDLYDKEKVDLETLVIDNVFKLLQCDDKGLSPEEVERRIGLFGHNKLEQEDQNPFLQVGIFYLFVSHADSAFSSSRSCGTLSPGSWRLPP